jgi:hypothetical protein
MKIIQNNFPEFVGIEQIKAQHTAQLKKFETWASMQEWKKFHIAHYDWWTFPCDRPSKYAYAYSVFAYEINILKKDTYFMSNYMRACELLLVSWGWDIHTATMLKNRKPEQTWQNWAIRLYKCALSLQQFGMDNYFQSVKQYALFLLAEKQNFNYYGEDLAQIFLE